MTRLFKTSNIRKIEELDGLWDFYIPDLDKADKMPVPACWETHPEYSTFRGMAVYTRKINVTTNTNLRLVFKGVSHTATVYFDGKIVAEHYNAYTPFEAVVPNVQPGEHEIMVEVDNSFNEESSLHMPNDYYTYGGIVRPVVMEYLPNTYIERVAFTPKFCNGFWQAHIKVHVRNISNETKEWLLSGSIGEKRFEFGEKTFSNFAVFESTFDMPHVKNWSPEDPNLYMLNITLSYHHILYVTDDLNDRVGFREVSVRGEKILLNGKEIFIKGFNRHEDHPFFGMSLDLRAMVTDIALIKDMNANTVRTSHYPNDELFLDLCDENGLMVWEENHARGLDEEKMRNPNFDKQCFDCIDEMVKNHYNHPSIIIWGVLNECASNTVFGRECYERQIKQIRNMDDSRPVTFASHHKESDICLDLVDIVSWNLYYGWYENIPSSEGLEKILEYTNANNGNRKPVIISEFGAGGIPGYRDRRNVKWSEERQREILSENLKTYLNHERISGAIVWQFCDCLVTEEEWFMQRPRTKNNKGIVDQNRQPKLAYHTVKELFGNKFTS